MGKVHEEGSWDSEVVPILNSQFTPQFTTLSMRLFVCSSI